MKTGEDKLGEYYFIEYSIDEYARLEEEIGPIRQLIHKCIKCQEKFEQGDKAYKKDSISYICQSCRQKQKTAKAL